MIIIIAHNTNGIIITPAASGTLSGTAVLRRDGSHCELCRGAIERLEKIAVLSPAGSETARRPAPAPGPIPERGSARRQVLHFGAPSASSVSLRARVDGSVMAASDGGGVSREGVESAGRLLDQHSKEDLNYVELSGKLRIATHREPSRRTGH